MNATTSAAKEAVPLIEQICRHMLGQTYAQAAATLLTCGYVQKRKGRTREGRVFEAYSSGMSEYTIVHDAISEKVVRVDVSQGREFYRYEADKQVRA